MDAKIYPIAITSPSWQMFIKICQEHFDFSPTRPLDESGISLQTPVSFHKALVSIFDPKNEGRTLNFTSVAMLIVMSDDDWFHVITLLMGMPMLVKNYDNKKMVIVTGTINQWVESIKTGCHSTANKTVRKLMNDAHGLLCVAGFGFCFENMNATYHADNTYSLVRTHI